jgi:hypothetical protein
VSRETSLKKWIDSFSKYYTVTSIRRLYYKHNGSMNGLTNIVMKLVRKHPASSVGERVRMRRYAMIACRVGDNSYLCEKKRKRAYKKRKSKNGRATIYLEELKFEHFFDNEVPTYFTDKGIEEKTFAQLEIILKDYYDEYSQIQRFKKIIKQDSIKKREEKIKEILVQANSILCILNDDLHNELPTEVKIKTIGELNKTTEDKLKELDLAPAYPYSQLFKAIRKI